jgi:hypothetical protein
MVLTTEELWKRTTSPFNRRELLLLHRLVDQQLLLVLLHFQTRKPRRLRSANGHFRLLPAHHKPEHSLTMGLDILRFRLLTLLVLQRRTMLSIGPSLLQLNGRLQVLASRKPIHSIQRATSSGLAKMDTILMRRSRVLRPPKDLLQQ